MRELCSTLLAAQNDEAMLRVVPQLQEVLCEYRELTHKGFLQKEFLQEDGDDYRPMNRFSHGDPELVHAEVCHETSTQEINSAGNRHHRSKASG